MANKLVLDFSRWSYEQFNQFLTNYAAGKFEEILPVLMEVVVSWTYDIPLSADAYKKLAMPELRPIINAVNDTSKAYYDGVAFDEVKIDLARWNLEDFINFRKAARENDYDTYEKLICKITRLKGIEPDVRLTAAQGIALTKAYDEAQKKLFAKGE